MSKYVKGKLNVLLKSYVDKDRNRKKKLFRNVQILNNDLKRIICTYTYTMKTKQKTIEDTRLIFLYVRRTFHLHRLIYDAQLKKGSKSHLRRSNKKG